MSAAELIGLVISDDNEVVGIYTAEEGTSVKDCYFNNDPYGIVNYCGFKDMEFKPFEKTVRIENAEANSVEYGYSPEYKSLLSMLKPGKCVGVIQLTNGYILIKDTYAFRADLKLVRPDGSATVQAYEKQVVVSDEDDVCNIDESVLVAMEVI